MLIKSKTKEELEQEIGNFNQEIYELDMKNKEISTKIECFKIILQSFEKQKKANKWWRLFWNFNKETNEMQIKIRDLSEELDKNAKKNSKQGNSKNRYFWRNY